MIWFYCDNMRDNNNNRDNKHLIIIIMMIVMIIMMISDSHIVITMIITIKDYRSVCYFRGTSSIRVKGLIIWYIAYIGCVQEKSKWSMWSKWEVSNRWGSKESTWLRVPLTPPIGYDHSQKQKFMAIWTWFPYINLHHIPPDITNTLGFHMNFTTLWSNFPPCSPRHLTRSSSAASLCATPPRAGVHGAWHGARRDAGQSSAADEIWGESPR